MSLERWGETIVSAPQAVFSLRISALICRLGFGTGAVFYGKAETPECQTEVGYEDDAFAQLRMPVMESENSHGTRNSKC